MATEVRLEDIQAALSQWARNEIALKDRVRVLESKVEEQGRTIRNAVQQAQDSFGLERDQNMTLRVVVEEALLAMQAASAEQVRTMAGQRDQIDLQMAKLIGYEQEIRESIEAMVSELEMPANPNRTLRNAVYDVCTMINEAKKIVQENL